MKKTQLPMTNSAIEPAKLASQLAGSADRRIRAFLSGETNGEDVLNALYGGAPDEPVPQRIRDLLKR